VEGIMRDRNYVPLTEIGREMLHKGRVEGRAEGLSEGRSEGLRLAVASACEAAGLPWSDARAATIAQLDAPALEALLRAIVRGRSWPSH
jgi:hypothetical protein